MTTQRKPFDNTADWPINLKRVVLDAGLCQKGANRIMETFALSVAMNQIGLKNHMLYRTLQYQMSDNSMGEMNALVIQIGDTFSNIEGDRTWDKVEARLKRSMRSHADRRQAHWKALPQPQDVDNSYFSQKWFLQSVDNFRCALEREVALKQAERMEVLTPPAMITRRSGMRL